MVEGIVSGFCWFISFLIAHVALFHRRHVENCFSLIVRIYLICLSGHAATVLLAGETRPPSERFAALICGLVLMGCLFILYMPFYYNVVNSLSIQTLIILRESAGLNLPLERLQERFAGESIVAGRLDTMVANGYLERGSGKYFLTAKGRWVARFFASLKAFWRMGVGG